jgi:hypothetical protein
MEVEKKMTDAALLDIVKRLPPDKAQELYDFALFLAQSVAAGDGAVATDKIAAFESETEMVDYINDVGRYAYAD